MAWLISIPPGKRVLMVGCGNGTGLTSVAKLRRPASMTGIDINAERLAQATVRMDAKRVGGKLVQGDVCAMPFKDRSFDIVIDFGTCFHISGTRQALHEITRVLEYDGMFVHETRLAQFLSHPRRSLEVPAWCDESSLATGPWAGMWAVRRKK